MPSRILFTAFALLCATATARAQKDGAAIDVETGTVFVVAAPVQVSTTFVEFHSARVEHDLMLFKPTLVGIAPIGRSRNAELFSTAPAKKAFGFLAPAESGDALEVRRDRDPLQSLVAHPGHQLPRIGAEHRGVRAERVATDVPA